MIFFLIPKNELNQQMVNLSTSRDKAQAPVRLYGNQPFYVLEVTDNNAENPVFYPYRRYFSHELDQASPATPGQKINFEGIPALSGAAPANQTTTFSYTVDENKVLKAVAVGVSNSNFLDHIDMQVFSGETKVGQHVKNLFVVDGRTLVEVPQSLVLAGLIIKLTYTNTGANNAKIFINLLWSKE